MHVIPGVSLRGECGADQPSNCRASLSMLSQPPMWLWRKASGTTPPCRSSTRVPSPFSNWSTVTRVRWLNHQNARRWTLRRVGADGLPKQPTVAFASGGIQRKSLSSGTGRHPLAQEWPVPSRGSFPFRKHALVRTFGDGWDRTYGLDPLRPQTSIPMNTVFIAKPRASVPRKSSALTEQHEKGHYSIFFHGGVGRGQRPSLGTGGPHHRLQ